MPSAATPVIVTTPTNATFTKGKLPDDIANDVGKDIKRLDSNCGNVAEGSIILYK